METQELEYDKFSEELYLSLMSSQLKERIEKLGFKNGLCAKKLREDILAHGGMMPQRIEIPMSDERYPILQREVEYQN